MQTNQMQMNTFDQEIRDAMRVDEIDSTFLHTLRLEVLSEPMKSRQPGRKRLLISLAASSLALSMMIIAFLLIGPEKVYADLKMAWGYVSGYGFIQADDGMVLKAPVSQSHGEREVTIEQFVSANQSAVLSLRFSGFANPPDPSFGHIQLEWTDGPTLYPTGWAIENAESKSGFLGVYKFPTLPAGTKDFTLSFTQDGEEWALKAELVKRSENGGDIQFPATYQINDNSSSNHDITLRIDQISSSHEGIALLTHTTFPDLFLYVLPGTAVLVDDKGRQFNQENTLHYEDQGQVIGQVPDGMDAGHFLSTQWTFAFTQAPSDAQRYTLLVGQMNFDVTPTMLFKIDIPEEVKAGDTWPINQELALGDSTTKVIRARLVELEAGGPSQYGLVLDFDETNRSEIGIDQVWLSVAGSPEDENLYDQVSSTWTPAWSLDSIPHGAITIQITLLRGHINGPWKITWNP